MISVSTVKELLVAGKFEQVWKLMSKHFESPEKSDLVFAGKVLAVFGFHFYHLKKCDPVEQVETAIEFFVMGLQCLTQQSSVVKEDQAKHGLDNIFYVLGKGLIRFQLAKQALIFCTNTKVLDFLRTFKSLIRDPQLHTSHFNKLLMLAFTQTDNKLASQIIEAALTFYVTGAIIDASTNYLQKSVANLKILQRKKLPESVEEQEYICRNVVTTFENLLKEKHLPDGAYGDFFDYCVFLIEVCYFTGFVFRQGLSARRLSNVEPDFLKANGAYDLVPDAELSRCSHHVENIMIFAFQVAHDNRSKLNLPKVVTRSFLEKNIEIYKRFHQVCPEVNMKTKAAEKSFSLLINVLSEMRLFKDAMMTIADCLVSTTPTSGHLSTVNKVVNVKVNALEADDSVKNLTLLQLIIEKRLMSPKAIFQIAKLEATCYRRTSQFENERKMLVGWIKKYAPQGSADQAMVLLEECWSNYFQSKEVDFNIEQCTKALEILKMAPSSACLPIFKALTMFCLFMHRWKKISELLSKDLEDHSVRVTEKKQKQKEEGHGQIIEAEMDDIRPFDVHLTCSVEEKNLELIFEVLRIVEKECPSQESILADGWLGSERTLFSIVFTISELLRLAGDDAGHSRSLKLWLTLAEKFNCQENKCFALHALVRHHGMQDWLKPYFVSALEKCPSDYCCHKLQLATAWGLFHKSEFEACLRICGNLLTDAIFLKAFPEHLLLHAEVYLLVARSRYSAGSKSFYQNQEPLPDFCVGCPDIVVHSAFEILRKAYTRIHTCFKVTAFEIRHELATVHTWCGIPKEMRFYSNHLIEIAAGEMPTTFMIVKSLLQILERALHFDDAAFAQVVLQEISGIINGILGKKSEHHTVAKSDKVRLVLPGEEDIAASPSLVRNEPELPSWLVKHKIGCSCFPCSRPIVTVFLVKYFTYQAVTYTLLTDLQGAFSVFLKLSKISKVVLDKAETFKDCGNSIADLLRLSVFEAIRWEVEVRGRLLQFDVCQKLLEELNKVRATFSIEYVKKIPLVESIRADLLINVKAGLRDEVAFAKISFMAPSPLPASHHLEKSVFLTPEIHRPSESPVPPRRPLKKLTALPAAVEADLDLLSKLTITDVESDSTLCPDTSKPRTQRATKAPKTGTRNTQASRGHRNTRAEKENGDEGQLRPTSSAASSSLQPSGKRSTSRSRLP